MNTTIMLSRVTPKRVHMIRRYNSTLPKSQEPSISASPSPSSPSSSPHPGHPSSSSTSTSDPSDQPSSSSSSGISLSTQTLPSPPLGPISTSSSIPMWNPFHTHNFFRALEKSFPESVARTLMRATRGLLVGKIAGTKKDVLVAKDLENVKFYLPLAVALDHSHMYVIRKRICLELLYPKSGRNLQCIRGKSRLHYTPRLLLSDETSIP
jgi:hypothetical protein